MSQEQRVTVNIPAINYSSTIPVSNEWAFVHAAERFPQHGHTVVHPITPEIQDEYAKLEKRWHAARTEWDAVVAEAVRKGWGTEASGYDWEDAVLEPLTERREFVPEETADEHRARVLNILDHHKKTGEWLEQPQPTFMELAMRSMLNAFDVNSEEKQ